MMTWLIALVARRLKLAPWLAELFAGILVVCALIALIWWQRVDAYRDGVRATDAKWAEASARMQAKVVAATNAANALARDREAENAAVIEDLKNEAAKGTAEPVGVGVRGVLERLRTDQSRRGN